MKVIVWTAVSMIMWLASTLSLEFLRPCIAAGLFVLAMVALYMAYRQFRNEDNKSYTTKYRPTSNCRDMSIKQRQ